MIAKEELVSRITPHLKALLEAFFEDCAGGQGDDELRAKMARAVETAMIGLHGACDVLARSHGKGIVKAEVVGDAPRVTPSILLDAGLAAPSPSEPSN